MAEDWPTRATRLAEILSELQAEINAQGMRDPRDAEIERLHKIETAARDLDANRNEGYATLVSYLIRLHEALE